MELGLRGKSALVTGASKGIGFACAQGLAAEGCDLHLAARSAEQLDAAKKTLVTDHGVKVTTHVCDLSSTEAMVAATASAEVQRGVMRGAPARKAGGSGSTLL